MLTSLTEAQIQQIKADYPVETRIECVRCTDPYAPIPAGTLGTVQLVDDIGQVHAKWDNGRGLALNPEEDKWRKVE